MNDLYIKGELNHKKYINSIEEALKEYDFCPPDMKNELKSDIQALQDLKKPHVLEEKIRFVKYFEDYVNSRTKNRQIEGKAIDCGELEVL